MEFPGREALPVRTWNVGHCERVSKEWLMMMIATLEPQHEIFEPSFTFAPRSSDGQFEVREVFDPQGLL